MLEAPEGIDAELIADRLARHWGIEHASVRYAAVGHGSANWIAHEPANVPDGSDGLDGSDRSDDGPEGTRWFVKLDPADAADFLDVTYRTAAELRDGGLDFVSAAVPDREGNLRQRVGGDYDMAVFRFIDGRNPELFGPERAGIAEVIGRLHAYSGRPTALFDWEPGYQQPELRALMADDLGRVWDQGPYGERARDLVVRCASGIERLFALHDRLLERLLASDVPWVLTHGEPHDGNTRLDTSGRFHLIDCNAMMLAPAERDLRLLLHGGHERALSPTELGLDNAEVLAAYRRGLRAGGADPDRPSARIRDFVLELYRAEWHLMEISSYARRFRDPHEQERDSANAWLWLNTYLPVTRNWPELAG